MGEPEWSLIEYRKVQQSKEFELAADLHVIANSPSNEDEVANQLRMYRAEKEAEKINKLTEQAHKFFEEEKEEEAAKLLKEAATLNDKGMDYLIENVRTQVLDPDGKKVAFNRLRQCFGSQDEVVAFLRAMAKAREDADPQGASNGSAN